MEQALCTERPSDELLLEVRNTLIRYWVAARRKSYDEAEDLAQEGIAHGLEVLDKFEGRSSLKTFLIRVGINRGKDCLKKEPTSKGYTHVGLELADSALIRMRYGRRRGNGHSELRDAT